MPETEAKVPANEEPLAVAGNTACEETQYLKQPALRIRLKRATAQSHHRVSWGDTIERVIYEKDEPPSLIVDSDSISIESVDKGKRPPRKPSALLELFEPPAN
jgi:hypothetical protein